MMLPSPAATPLKRSAAIETPKGIRRVRLKLPQTQPVAEDGSAIEDEDVNMESTEVSNSLPGKTIMTDHARSPFLDFTAGCRGTMNTTHIYSRPSRSCRVNEKVWTGTCNVGSFKWHRIFCLYARALSVIVTLFLCLALLPQCKAATPPPTSGMLPSYALNTKGLVHPGILAHINTALTYRFAQRSATLGQRLEGAAPLDPLISLISRTDE